jgi:hypothetical protein
MRTKYEIAEETAIGHYFTECPEEKTWEEIKEILTNGSKLPDDLIVSEAYEDWNSYSLINAVELMTICIEDSINEWINQ